MVSPNRGARLIFVGGAERSGTTLVQNVLDSHPDICGAPEFHHIPDIVSLRRKLYHSIDRKHIDLICSYNEVDHLICSFIENMLYPLADKYGCQFLSEKTPNNILVFPELIDLFPKSHFIYVVRDPRAIIASMLQVGIRGKKAGWKMQDFTQSMSAAISYVKRCYKSGVTSYKAAPEKVLIVAYEQLVSNPEYETKRICSFLKIKWSNKMLCPGSIKHLGEKAVTNDVWYDTKSYNRDVEPYEVDKWKNQLTYTQKVVITTAFMGNEDLARCGYVFSSDDLSRINRVVGFIIRACLHLSKMVVGRSVALARRGRTKVRQRLRFLHHVANPE